jgi:hypothetical protein
MIDYVHLKHFIFSSSLIENYENGRLEGMKLVFSNNDKNYIYTKSHRTNFTPAGIFTSLSFKLTTRQFISFYGTLIESLSTYLYNIRYQVSGEQFLETMIHLKEDERGRNNYSLRISNNRKKHRKEDSSDKETATSRYKVMIAIIDNNIDEELLEIRLTKRDVILLVYMLQSELEGMYRVFNFASSNSLISDTDEDIKSSTDIVNVSKIDNSMVFNNVFLHGQEVLNLNYIIDKLVFGYEIEDNLEALFFNYRQVSTFKVNDFMLGLKINKMEVDERLDGNHEHRMTEEVQNITFNNKLLGGLVAFMSPKQLRHSSSDYSNTGVSTSPNFGGNALYHISMRESSIGIGAKNYNYKVDKNDEKQEKFFRLMGESKESMGEKDYESMIKHYKNSEATEHQLVNRIEQFNLNLGNHWIDFLMFINKSYLGEWDESSEGINQRWIYTRGENKGKQANFIIKLHSDKKNKAKMTLNVEQIEGKEKNVVAKFRQAFFYRYLHELITISMYSALEIDEFKFSITKPYNELMPVNYKAKRNLAYVDAKDGKKTKVEIIFNRTEGKNVEIKYASKRDKFAELSRSDILALNISCKRRILFGEWLAFTGEQVSVSQQGFFTMVDFELDMENDADNEGLFFAWQLFFVTAI